MKKILKNPLFSGSLVMVGGSMGANVVNYFYHLIMGRLLGPVDYGTLASVFAVLYVVSVVPMSTSFAVVKFISAAKTNSELTGIFYRLRKLVFWLAFVLGGLLVVMSPLIAIFLHVDNFWIIALVGVVMFFSLNTLMFQSTLQGLLRFWGFVGPVMVSSVGKLVIGVTLVLAGWSVMGAVVGVLVAIILAYMYARSMLGNIPLTEKYENFYLRPFLLYSLPVLIQALAFTSIFTTDVILVKHYLPEFDVGLYAALSTLGKIVYFAVQPVSSTMFPIVSGKRSRGEGYRKVFYVSFLLSLVMSLGIVLAYYLLPRLAIGVLYGEAYLSAKGELVWMGLFIAVYTWSYLLVNFLLSIGRTRIVILPFVAALIQIVAIALWHDNILQVIQVSLVVVSVMFAGLVGYLVSYQVRRIYAKK